MHILIVDNDALALEQLCNRLRLLFPAAQLHCEESAAAALAFAELLSAQNKTLSYAFLETELEEISGIALAGRIRQLHPKAALFFCTSHTAHALEAFSLFAKAYLIKPITAADLQQALDATMPDWRTLAQRSGHEIRIQTFGHFEAFVNSKQLVFEREKSKELFAYLVDRRGASVTTEQIALTLWENEPYDRKLKNRTTATVSSLKNTLRHAGIEYILVKSWNHLALDTEQLHCDAYEYERDPSASDTYHGEYMLNYSWAELTNGELSRLRERRQSSQ